MFISVANLLRVFDRICQAHFYFTFENVDFGQKMLIRGSGGRGGRRGGTEGITESEGERVKEERG